MIRNEDTPLTSLVPDRLSVNDLLRPQPIDPKEVERLAKKLSPQVVQELHNLPKSDLTQLQRAMLAYLNGKG